MAWMRAFISGMIGALMMMCFMDTFYMMGLTPFSYEMYLGSLIFGNPFSPNAWTLGFLANLGMGGLFGIFYAYCFEFVFKESSARVGIHVVLYHMLVDALFVFPFFQILHGEVGTGLYPSFGLLGFSLNPGVPALLLVAHLIFGASMGTFYGPVRIERVRMRFAEPGETGPIGAWNVITEEDDPRDRASSFKGSA